LKFCLGAEIQVFFLARLSQVGRQTDIHRLTFVRNVAATLDVVVIPFIAQGGFSIFQQKNTPLLNYYLNQSLPARYHDLLPNARSSNQVRQQHRFANRTSSPLYCLPNLT